MCFPPLFSVTHKRLFLSPVPSCAHTDTPKPLLFLQVTSGAGGGRAGEGSPGAPSGSAGRAPATLPRHRPSSSSQKLLRNYRPAVRAGPRCSRCCSGTCRGFPAGLSAALSAALRGPEPMPSWRGRPAAGRCAAPRAQSLPLNRAEAAPEDGDLTGIPGGMMDTGAGTDTRSPPLPPRILEGPEPQR